MLAAEYLVIRRTRLDLDGLYRRGGPYWYANGFNPVGLVAMAAGVVPCVPGFLNQVAGTGFPGEWDTVYTYAWFVSFGVAFAVYVVGMWGRGQRFSVFQIGSWADSSDEANHRVMVIFWRV